MSKYAPLGDFLRMQGAQEVPMTFREIERVIGMALPAASRAHRGWWSNNPSNNVMTKVWLDAGFKSERVDLAGRRLVFRRARKAEREKQPVATAHGRNAPTPLERHPLRGLLREMTHLVEGVDLSRPADPDWGRDAERKYGR